MTVVKGLPVHGYQTQTEDRVSRVNSNKILEEQLLRICDTMMINGLDDRRWTAVARTHFEEGFMALNRAIFQPQRLNLDTDTQGEQGGV